MSATVSFIFRPKQEASLVEIAGSFNDWTKTVMVKDCGHWKVCLEMKPGMHQYKYIVDGVWQHDEHLPTDDDKHGGKNNVINVDYEDDSSSDDTAVVISFGGAAVHQRRSMGTFIRAPQLQSPNDDKPQNRFPIYQSDDGSKRELMCVQGAETKENTGSWTVSPGLKHSTEMNLTDPNQDLLPPKTEWMYCRDDKDCRTYQPGWIQDDTVEVLLKEARKSNIMFVHCSGGSIPPNAYPGGKDENGETLYVARAKHGKSLVPGKLQPSAGFVFVSYGGKMLEKSEYEVLVQEGSVDNLRWISFDHFKYAGRYRFKIEGIIACGYEDNGTPLYVARAKIGDQMVIGKVGFRDTCWIPLDGKEIEITSNYEILCCNELAVRELSKKKVLSNKNTKQEEDEEEAAFRRNEEKFNDPNDPAYAFRIRE